MELFRKKLIEVINDSDLPFDARYYVIKDVYRDVLDLYENFIKEQEALAKKHEMEAYQKSTHNNDEPETIPYALEVEEVD